MTQEELDKIVEQHQHWLKKDCEGWEHMKAYLRGFHFFRTRNEAEEY